jgi:predicted Zn-dependent protease with MMP-like domain
MKREDFVKVAEETLDSLPEEFRSRIQNVAILVEDFPANQRPPKLGQRRRLLLGIFHGVPATKRSVFNLLPGRITSCFIRRILRRSAQARPKCVIKFARLSYTNWGTILG